jgi:hypothetical protein
MLLSLDARLSSLCLAKVFPFPEQKMRFYCEGRRVSKLTGSRVSYECLQYLTVNTFDYENSNLQILREQLWQKALEFGTENTVTY